jgi:O-antigen/teichoic acid export membrane protein
MSTLLGGPLFGPKQVGYLTWGLSLSQTVSHPLVQILARVCFPAFARLADEPEEREKLLVDSLYWLNMLSYPVLMLLAAHGSPIVRHVFGEAWRPALWALDAFCFRMMGTNVTSMLVGYLNATGRSSTGFRVAAVWTVLEWGLAIAFSTWLGFNGIALAYAVGVLIPVVWLLTLVGREAKLQLHRTFGLPLLLGAVGVAVALGLQPLVKTIWTFVPVLAVSVVVPYGAIALLERRRLVAMVRRRLSA